MHDTDDAGPFQSPSPSTPAPISNGAAPRETTLEAALKLAARGWKVFPCRSNKAPYTPHGFYDATADESTLRQWWRKWPEALIGVPTGAENGFIVVDIDVDRSQGKDGEAVWSCILEGLDLPVTPMARTPRGGRHLYFKHPGYKVLSTSNQIGPGIDTRADGGYVIVPPSFGYGWFTDPSKCPLADAPAWLQAILPREAASLAPIDGPSPAPSFNAAPAITSDALSDACTKIQAAPNGAQEQTLNAESFRIGWWVAKGHYTRDEALDRLLAAARAMPTYDLARPWEASQLRDKVVRALDDGIRSPSVEWRHTTNGGELLGPSPSEWPKPADILSLERTAIPPFPLAFLPEPLRSRATDIAERMQCPADFVGIALLIAAATAIGRHIRLAPKRHDPWTERVALWGAVVGRPGSMKSPAIKAALDPLFEIESRLLEEHKKGMEAYAAAVEAAEEIAKAWQDACKEARKKGEPEPAKPDGAEPPPCPRSPRLSVTDTTQEMLAQLMAASERGLMLFRDELSGWLLSLNQYRAGADRQFFLECHSGGRWTQDRKTRPSYVIEDLYPIVHVRCRG